MKVLKQLPDVIGFYQPGDRRQDWDGLITDPKTGELVKELSMTKQSFVQECDINNIVFEFTQHGMVTHVNERAQQGAFVDLPDSVDYQEAIEIARSAQTAFDQLPAHIRRRFDNSPEKFLDFLQDPANQDEAIKLGLATDSRAKEPSESPAPVSPEPATP